MDASTSILSEDAGEIRTKRIQSPTIASTAPAASTNIADELIKLKQLLDAKVLTQAEFTAQKNRLLKQQVDATSSKTDETPGKLLGNTQTDDDIIFKVISEVGNRKNQTVTVILSFTNKAANKNSFNSNIRSCTSADGEEFVLQRGMVGNDGSSKTLFTDAPIKGTYVFAGILPKVNLIKLFPVPYGYSSPNLGYKTGQVEFRDISISWK
ncbi:MAG: SHOCT domain-containing protein [Hymenobacter sp.]